jgi:FMN reductase
VNIVAVVGNPKRESRTAQAAESIAKAMSGESVEVVELTDFGSSLLDWGARDVTELVRRVGAADVAIFASPTFKATYSGLLKIFLDRFAGSTGLQDVVAIPLMLGAGTTHALAPELHLKPVLVELGATCPTPGLYILDTEVSDSQATVSWIERWGPVVLANVRREVVQS